MHKQSLFNITTLLLCIPFYCTAQSDTSWYRHIVMDSFEVMFPSGLEPCGQDAVVIINASAYFDDPPYNRSALVRIDGDNGDILWQTRIIHNPVAENSSIFFLNKGLIRLHDGSFIVTFDTHTENGDTGFVINRVGADGSVLWHKDYGISGQDILPIINGLGIGPDSMSFVVTAHRVDVADPYAKIIIYHINEDGNVVNLLNVNTELTFYSEYCPVAMLEDSSFVVGFNLGNNLDFEGLKLLRQYNYSGQNTKTYMAWDFGWWNDLKRHPSGMLLAVSQSFSGDWDHRESHGLRTTLFSPILDTIWSRVYNQFELPYYYRELDYPGPVSFDPQGNILVSGSGSAYDGVKPVHLIKYNVDGEAQWIKRIGIGPDLVGGVQELGGKIVFVPQGILLVGALLGVNEMLLIRLDSSGCINEPTCETEFLLKLKVEPHRVDLDYNLFPNPTTAVVNFTIGEDYFHLLTNPRIHIVDITGFITNTFSLNGSNQQLNLSSLPNGFYFGVLESNGSPVGFQKLVKW